MICVEYDPDESTIEIVDEWEIHLEIDKVDIVMSFDDLQEIYLQCKRELYD